MLGLIPPQAWEIEWTALNDIILNLAPAGYVCDASETTTTTTTQADGTTVVTCAPAAPVQPSNPNAVSTHSVTINTNSGGALSILGGNPNRKLLILQNNSTATSPDVAPTFYFGFGQLAQVGQGLGLAPGVGMVLDESCPIDSVFLTIGPSTNTDGSVVVQGVAVEGSQAT